MVSKLCFVSAAGQRVPTPQVPAPAPAPAPAPLPRTTNRRACHTTSAGRHDGCRVIGATTYRRACHVITRFHGHRRPLPPFCVQEESSTLRAKSPSSGQPSQLGLPLLLDALSEAVPTTAATKARPPPPRTRAQTRGIARLHRCQERSGSGAPTRVPAAAAAAAAPSSCLRRVLHSLVPSCPQKCYLASNLNRARFDPMRETM